MPNITITSDGTVKGTSLTLDGKEVTKKDKVIGIYLSAHAPYRSSYTGDLYKGGVSIEYATLDDNGIVKREQYGTTDTNYENGIGKKIKSEDKLQDNVIRFLGQDADVEVTNLVDSIVAHCEEKGIKCPDKDTLLNRQVESLKDKAIDLGIKLEG